MISFKDPILRDQIKLHEGARNRPYTDTRGKITIGIGRNLTDCGISDEEREFLYTNDLKKAIHDVELYYPWVGKLSINRQMVVVEMCFNLGIEKLRSFHNTMLAIAHMDFELAAEEMLESLWATQVGQRAKDLATQMRHG